MFFCGKILPISRSQFQTMHSLRHVNTFSGCVGVCLMSLLRHINRFIALTVSGNEYFKISLQLFFRKEMIISYKFVLFHFQVSVMANSSNKHVIRTCVICLYDTVNELQPKIYD
jgi:hypothetical protein